MNLKDLAFKNVLSKPVKIVIKNPYTNEPLLDDNGESLGFDIYHRDSSYVINKINDMKRDTEKDDLTGAEVLALSVAKIYGTFNVDSKLKLKDDNKTYDKLVKLFLEIDFVGFQVLSATSDLSTFNPKK